MEGYLAGCNRAVSPFAGTAEKDEKKSAKDTRGTVFSIQHERVNYNVCTVCLALISLFSTLSHFR